MKIFISQKFRGVDKKILKEKIKKVALALEKRGHSTFNYFRDRENWQPGKYPQSRVIREALEEIRKCDAILAIINQREKSEGMLLEIGFAKALGKKVILLIFEGFSSVFLETLADKIIRLKSLEEINKKLENI